MITAAAALACAVALAACGSAAQRAQPAAGPTHRVPTSTTSTTAGAGTITARLVLDETTVPADGRDVRGVLVVDNESGRPITLHNAPCDGWVRVGLANRRVDFLPGFPSIACRSSHLPVGTSHTPVTVATRYDECHQGPAPEQRMPRCEGTAHDGMPRLPAGRYRVETHFVGVTPSIPEPPRLTVTLTTP